MPPHVTLLQLLMQLAYPHDLDFEVIDDMATILKRPVSKCMFVTCLMWEAGTLNILSLREGNVPAVEDTKNFKGCIFYFWCFTFRR